MLYRLLPALLTALIVLPLTAAETATPVKTAPVVVDRFAEYFEALGTARAKQAVDITSKVTGTVAEILFKDGQWVEQNQLLVQLDDREERTQLAIAELQVTDHQRELERLKSLRTTGAAHQGAVDNRQTEYDIAVQQVAQLQVVLDDYQIKAPFSGLLGLGAVSDGALIQPGDFIVSLEDITTMELDFTVPETWQSAIAIGQTVAAIADAFDEQVFDGTIGAIDNRIDPVTRSIRVRAMLDNSAGLLRSGQLMRVTLYSGERETLMIPEAALIPRQDRQYVLVVSPDNLAEERLIVIDGRRPGEVEVVEGLVAGEQVIVEGTHRVKDGAMVRVLNEK